MKTAALFPVGTTAGGCISAIRGVLSREESLEVFILHGVLAPGQGPPDPADMAREIKGTDFGHPVSWKLTAPIDTFDLSSAYQTARETVRTIATERYDRVYVGITGGANPLVASVFHAALTYLDAEVVPIYVQGKGLTTERTFFAPDLRLSVLAEEAIAIARSGQTRVAAQLAARLPDSSPGLFVKVCLAALADWDDFDYARARDALRRQQRHCDGYRSDVLLAPLADTVARLALVVGRMVKTTVEFRDLQNFEKLASASGWSRKVRECGGLLVLDALNNARRRLQEGRYTDSVLRSYRAAECATQVRLYEMGIHPAKPSAFEKAFAQTGGIIEADKPIAFARGLALLQNAGQITLDEIAESVQDLGQTRNSTYLEHGYVRIQRGQAERCLNHAETICQHLLEAAIVATWPDLSMKL